MCLLANTSEGKPHMNKSLIIVPMDTKGVVKAKKIDKMGMHSSDTGLIFFEDVRVPIKNTIGEEGQGFIYQMLQFQVSTGSSHFTRFHFTRFHFTQFHFTWFTLYTAFRKITSLLVKFTLYTEKNIAKLIFVLMTFMFHFTLLFIKNKNR